MTFFLIWVVFFVMCIPIVLVSIPGESPHSGDFVIAILVAGIVSLVFVLLFCLFFLFLSTVVL